MRKRMILKPSNIIIIFTIVAVIFIGYQNDLIQRLFGEYDISVKFKKSVESVTDLTAVESIPPAISGKGSSEMRMMELAPPVTPELQMVELRSKMELLEYRIIELEKDYQTISDSLQKKSRKFDDLLALFGTFMPLIVTYITIKNKDKVDNAGARIKTFWNKK